MFKYYEEPSVRIEQLKITVECVNTINSKIFKYIYSNNNKNLVFIELKDNSSAGSDSSAYFLSN